MAVVKRVQAVPASQASFARILVGLGLSVLAGSGALAQSAEDDLAKKLANPVASLISVPFQWNYDGRIGPLDKGSRQTLNIQPVIPIPLNADWNLISRTIVPLIRQTDIFPGAGSQAGVGDIVQSLFLSPAAPTGGIIWGVGPIVLVPTGSERLLSGRQWAAGPTAVALSQSGPWTIGMLGNHLWSFAETRFDARRISATFLNPFVTYNAAGGWSFTLQTETTYDWVNRTWTVPVTASVAKLTRIGAQPVSFNLGLRYYASSPAGAAKGLGVRASMVFLFPT